jgi:hypothetical protein
LPVVRRRLAVSFLSLKVILNNRNNSGVFFLHHYGDFSDGRIPSRNCEIARHDLVASKPRALQPVFTKPTPQILTAIIERA